MTETLAAWVEVWPFAADSSGIWLISGQDAWWPRVPVPSDSHPNWEVEALLRTHDVLDSTQLLRSTSWRMDRAGARLVLTYAAVVSADEPIVAAWPDASALTADVLRAVGPPKPSAATDPPVVRNIDVVLHCLRHLKFLLDTADSDARSALDGPWPKHLSRLSAVLAGLYLSSENGSSTSH